MSNLSRRQTLGLGLGAGLSVTMLGGPERRSRAGERRPSPCSSSTTSTRWPTTRAAAASPSSPRSSRPSGRAACRCCSATRATRFSPSLMSGFDQGAHIVELTNMIKPDVFVPGNHEFDFGKDVYLKRMGEANFPFFAANMRQADGSPIPGMKDCRDLRRSARSRSASSASRSRRRRGMSQPGDIKFVLGDGRRCKAQATALRRQGADIVVAVTHTDRDMDYAIVRSRLVDVLLTGHDHDLAIGYDGRTVMVESSEEGNFVTAIDFAAIVDRRGQGPQGGLGAELPRARFADGRSRSRRCWPWCKRYEGALSKELDVEIGTTATELDSRTATVRSQEAAIGNLIADAIRDVDGRRRRHHQRRRHPRQQAVPGRREADPPRHPLRTAVRQHDRRWSRSPAPTSRRRWRTASRRCEQRAGRFPQVSGLKFEVDPKRAGRLARRQRSRSTASRSTRPRSTRSRPTTSCSRAATAIRRFAKGRVLIGPTDGKLLANEVMVYVRRLGHRRREGRGPHRHPMTRRRRGGARALPRRPGCRRLGARCRSFAEGAADDVAARARCAASPPAPRVLPRAGRRSSTRPPPDAARDASRP